MKKFISASLIILLFSFQTSVFAQIDPYAPLQAAVDKLLENSPDAGVYILLPGDKVISNRQGETFSSFSVIKLWIAAAVFADAKEQGNEVDSTALALVEKMLQDSDNAATNQLLAQLGDCSNAKCDDRIKQFAAENGYNRTLIRRKMLESPNAQNDNLTSPEDAVNFMKNLVNRQIVDEATSDKIISILQTRTASGADPFKPNNPLPASADFIGKSGILGTGRNDVGSFLDTNGQRVFFAIFIPNGGTGSDQIISNIEQLIYSPSATPKSIGTTGSGQRPGPLTGNQVSVTSRVCVKVGTPAEAKPAICNTPSSISTSAAGGTVGLAQPAPTVEAGQLVQTIKSEFGVDMQGAWSEQALKWIYEAFYRWKQTNPKFMNFINGQPIILIPNASGANAYGNTVKVGQTYTEGEKFLGTLTHEFGHVIYWTKPLGENFRLEAENLYTAPGPITTYGDGDNTENYPEIISYCLTRRSVGSLMSQQRWEQYYKPIAEKIVGPCI